MSVTGALFRLDRDYIVAGHGTNANVNLTGARNATLTVRYSF
jgi:hypothetical protein